jgi:hypothetical protein
VIHSRTANIGKFKHCNSLVHFFLWGANVFTLDSNEHYFRSRNLTLPQDSHSLRGSTRDLCTVQPNCRTSGPLRLTPDRWPVWFGWPYQEPKLRPALLFRVITGQANLLNTINCQSIEQDICLKQKYLPYRLSISDMFTFSCFYTPFLTYNEDENDQTLIYFTFGSKFCVLNLSISETWISGNLLSRKILRVGLFDWLWWGQTVSQNRGNKRTYCLSPGDMWASGAIMMTTMRAGDNSWLDHQSSQAVILAETSGASRRNGQKSENFAYQYLKYLKGSLTCRKILRHGTSGFTSHPKEGVLRIFIVLENPSPSPGLNPWPLGPVASTLTTIPLSRFYV